MFKTGWRWFGSYIHYNTYIPIKIIPEGEKNLHLTKTSVKISSGKKISFRIQGWEVNCKTWETNKLKETDF